MSSPHPAIDTYTDGHVHTRICGHAVGEMEEYVVAAIDKGLTKMVFLEHLEAGITYIGKRTWLVDEEFDYYFREGERLKKSYGDRIEIGLGVEVGYNPACRQELQQRLASRSWERVGVSCHFLPIPHSGRHINLLSRRAENIALAREFGPRKLLTRYFANLIEGVQEIDGTVLCHLDAALRHVKGVSLTEEHYRQVEDLLDLVKAKGMAVELNTSAIPLGRDPYPAKPLLAMVIRRDIPLFAGSDAHRPQDVGRHFDTLPAYISSVVSP